MMAPPRARIAVLGSANMDLVASVPHFPAPGETLLGTGFATAPGGKGSNQAVAAARAGADVTFLGAVGDETFALDLRQVLVDAEVDVTNLREVQGPSGVAVITVAADGENTIVVVPGANATVTELTEGDHDAIAVADILLCQLELPLETVTAAGRYARDTNTLFVLNCAPAQSLPEDLIAALDVLVVNETEAEQVGTAVLDRVAHVVTTLGRAGARYRGPDGETTVPAAPVEVVDTTGAGDAFIGALAAYWHRGPQQALRAAVAAGALATTRHGATAAMPKATEIEQLMR